VLEGSPPDPAPVSAPAETTPPAEPSEAEVDAVVSTERTPEEVEAIWKNRVAGKDRAHNAEVAELRRQLDAAKAPKPDGSDSEDWKTKAEEAAALLAEEKKARALDVRSVKYAAAAESLDPETLASMDEAKLAALNARLSGDEETVIPPIDPSAAPRRSSAPPAGPRDKSVDELESDLKRLEPEYIGSLQDQT